MAESVIGTLIYRITGDTSALDKGLDVSRAKISKTGESLVKLGQRARQVGTVVFSGIFVKSILNAASNVEELGNKFDTVFKGMESSADSWARKYADDTNRGVTATKTFLATQQDLRTGYGDTVEAAARFSQAVVGVTNDLASFSNIPVADAMAAVQSGLAGEFQALKRLGVGLNEQIINEGAYAKALGKTWAQMNNLERQEAILSGIMSQSRNAIHQNVQIWSEYDYTLGDAAKTSDSFANSAQGLTQKLEDAKAELGESLLPIATEVLGTVIDLVDWFNSWDDSTQKLTVSLLAFGAAMVTIGGPVGAVVGALGALLVLVSGNRESVDDLKSSADALKKASNDYSTATKALSGDISDLTDHERMLLEVRREQARLDVQKTLNDAMTAYSDSTKELEKYSEALEFSKGAYNAYIYAIDNGYDAAEKKLEEYEKRVNELTSEEQGAYNALVDAVTDGVSGILWWTKKIPEDEFLLKMKEHAVEEYKTLTDLQQYETNYEAARANLIMSVAQALNVGAVSAETLKLLYPDIAEEILGVAEALKEEVSSIGKQGDALEAVITVSRQWRDQRRAQIADLLEEQGEYQKAADIRKQMLEDERQQEIRNLAVTSGIVEKEADLTDEILQSFLGSNEDFKAEYDAVNAYYASEAESVQKQVEAAIRGSNERQEQELRRHMDLVSSLNSQARDDRLQAKRIELDMANATKESLASTMDESGRYAEAAAIRLQALEAEYEFNQERHKAQIRQDLEELASKMGLVKAEEDVTQLDAKTLAERITATDEGLSALSAMNERHRQESLQAEQEYRSRCLEISNDAADNQKKSEEDLAKIRESNAKAWSDKLLQQAAAARESAAAEKQASGDIAGAYADRITLVEEEMQRELDALQVKIDANEASEQDKTNLLKYYSGKRRELEDQSSRAIADAAEKARDEEKAKWKSFFSELKGLATDFGSAYVNLYSVMTDNAIAEIDRQTQARLEALGIAEKSELEKLQAEYDEAVKAGDMELARERQQAIQRLQIEQEADAEKAKLQREQAERERNLRIFTTTLDMLSAVVKYLADPGGWAGVGLSAMAATTGAMQIAAIRSEALPSFDVGVNYVPEDMLAMIHQGETIIPAPMAESVRRGDAVFGQVQVQVNIENYSSENVSVREAEDGQTLTIMIGKAVEEGISSGRYDSALGNRFGIRKVGRNVR